MICQRCLERIEVGDACIPEAIDGSTHFRFFHPSCYTLTKGERDEASRLFHLADVARTVH